MSPAALLAALAGALAAAGVWELGVVAAERTARERPRRRLGAVGMAVLARVGRRFVPRAPGDLAGRLEAAGVTLSLADAMAVKAGGALVALLLALPVAPALPGRLPLVAFAAAPGIGFLAPDLWLRRRTRARGRAMEAELPDVLDLLRVAVAAGLSTGRALAEVGRRHPGALAAELRRTADRIQFGIQRGSALTELEARCPAPGIPAVVAALRRADRHGAPLAGTLAALAEDARATRARRAAEAAARAAPKIQLVIALLLVPAVLLLVAAALLPAVVDR
jgi:tight adherence protein C